jgi:formylglycine-generating enzyme required for sulfatase activity
MAANRGDRGLERVSGTPSPLGEPLYKGSYALVIGASDYQYWPKLPGVKEDVAAVKTELEKRGFQVTIVTNPNQDALKNAFDAFIQRYGLEPDYRLLIYFAGHGHTMEQSYGGQMGYIIPTDAPRPERDRSGFLTKAMAMQQIEVYATRIQSKHVLFLFDSCFSGSVFSLSRAVPQHISDKTKEPVRQFITAGSAKEEVPDVSVFRRQFVAALQGEGDTNRDGYITGTELGEFLYTQVTNYSRGTQHPQYGKLRHPELDKGDFVFRIEITIPQSALPAADPESEAWRLVKDSTYPEDLERFLQAYPNSRYAPVARLRLEQLRRPAQQGRPESPRPLSRADIERLQSQLKQVGVYQGPITGTLGRQTTAALRRYQEHSGLTATGQFDAATQAALAVDSQQREEGKPPLQVSPSGIPVEVTVRIEPTKPPLSTQGFQTIRNGLGMEFVHLPAGEFTMGSSTSIGNERPTRAVRLSRPFYLSKYEVTQAQWEAVMEKNPSYFKGDLNRPVEMVSWNEIQEFIQRLNAKEGRARYRLPTEAEWEYAARAGSAAHYSFGGDDKQLEQYGWYVKNAGGHTQPVGQRQPNAWGLHDMNGNVWEWVQDRYGLYTPAAATDPQGPEKGVLRVLRGGAWNQAPIHCRASARLYGAPQARNVHIGFRLVQDLP